MGDIQRCRSAALGGHMEKCDACGFERPAYNSCRNRHCPKCQSLAKAAWLEARRAEVLPVHYFHTVFTLPHEINPIAWCNKKIVYDLLFKAVSETLLCFGKNPKNGLGGKIGFIAMLHTWDQVLGDHLHLHCLVPGGALSVDHRQWIPAREDYLFCVKALSIVFRKKFVASLEKGFQKGKLIFPGNTAPLGSKTAFAALLRDLRAKDWVVYAKKPFAGPQKALDYLGRYTHRVAISNHRVTDVGNGKVSFTYRDRRDSDTLKTKTLPAEEFIRRFLLHVLPHGYVRMRHFGFLANRCKKQDLQACRQLLNQSRPTPEIASKTTADRMLELTGLDITKCPCCKKGTMKIIGEIHPFFDSS